MNEVDKRDAIQSDPKFFESILQHIAMGGTLLEFCKTTGINYYILHNEIKNDDYKRNAMRGAEEVRVSIIKDGIMAEVRDLAMFDISKVYDDSGSMLPFDKIPASITKAIKGIENDGIKTKLTFVDKLKAIDQLAKTTDIFAIKVELDLSDSLEALIDASFNKTDE